MSVLPEGWGFEDPENAARPWRVKSNRMSRWAREHHAVVTVEAETRDQAVRAARELDAVPAARAGQGWVPPAGAYT